MDTSFYPCPICRTTPIEAGSFCCSICAGTEDGRKRIAEWDAVRTAPRDFVHHPPHYNTGKIEVLEAIEDWKLDFHAGNTVKYVVRAGKKDPTKEVEDLEKARWYLNRKIELLKAEKEGRDPVRPNDMVRK